MEFEITVVLEEKEKGTYQVHRKAEDMSTSTAYGLDYDHVMLNLLRVKSSYENCSGLVLTVADEAKNHLGRKRVSILEMIATDQNALAGIRNLADCK